MANSPTDNVRIDFKHSSISGKTATERLSPSHQVQISASQAVSG